MAKCTQCGAQYQDGSRFCTVCGAAQSVRTAPFAGSFAGADAPPPSGSRYELMSTPAVIGTLLLMGIPVVGQVVTLVWALGGCRKLQKRNLARAVLVVTLIAVLLTALMGFLVKKAVETAIEESGIVEQLDSLRDSETGKLDLNALTGLLGEGSELGDLAELAEVLEQFQNLDSEEMQAMMEQMEQMQESGVVPSD